MTAELLERAGIQHRASRFPRPPSETYAVYTDDLATDGPDGLNWIIMHDVTIELYEPDMDDAAEASLETEMDAAGLRWTKQSRYWLQDTQRYQVIYEFSYTEKRRL